VNLAPDLRNDVTARRSPTARPAPRRAVSVPSPEGRSALQALPDLATAFPDGYGAGAIQLNLSESALGCSPLARDAVAAELNSLNRYPDPSAGALITALSQAHELDDDHFVVGNGTDELLLLTAIAFAADACDVIISTRTFPGHAFAAAAVGREPLALPLRNLHVDSCAIAEGMSPGSVIYLCNPHNPTGTALSASELEHIATSASDRGALLIVDEAYFDYTFPGETQSAIDLVRGGLPVIALRTFSKIYGLAGLRCGYATASPTLCARIRKLKNVLVFNVNRLALAAATASLADSPHRDRARALTRERLSAFQSWLAGQTWASTVPSVTNFALVETSWPATRLAAELAQRGILVRDCAGLGLPQHIRISMGLPNEMDAVQAALHDIANESGDPRGGGPRS
jgi:histidinol-phosphate aminotransferase